MIKHEDVKLRVRARDPLSSVLAAERSTQFSNSQKVRILAALAALGTATAREIGVYAGLELVQVDRRLPEVRKDGMAEVLQLNGEDVIRGGCRVWRLTEKNLTPSATNS